VTGAHTDCLKPWAILDRWDEWNGVANDFPNPDPDYNSNSTFDKYSDGKGGAPPAEPDLYVPPGGGNGAGTGFRLPLDEGRPFAVKVGDNSGTISSGWFRAIRVPRLDGQTGGSVYRSNIESCGGLPNGFATAGVPCPTDITNANAAEWANKGCYAVEPGNMIGPTSQGIETLVAKDPSARWSGTGIINSAFSPATSSPRVVPIGSLDVDTYLAADPTGAGGVVRLVNIYGYFIEGMGDVNADGSMTLSNSGKSVIGRIMTYPSTGVGSSNLPVEASFLRQVILVR